MLSSSSIILNFIESLFYFYANAFKMYFRDVFDKRFTNMYSSVLCCCRCLHNALTN